MKTTYSRIFVAAMVVLLLSLLCVGFFLRTLLEDYLDDSAFDRLSGDAKVISQLAAAYYTDGSMSNIDFLINVDIAGEVSDADLVICDSGGKILLCSEDLMDCPHKGLVVSKDYLDNVTQNGSAQATGVIQGLYEDSRYVCAVPIRLPDGTMQGIVIVSQPLADNQAILGKMTEIFLIASLFVTAVSVLVIGLYVKRQSLPLRDMTRAARAFGHGNLEARVEQKDYYPRDIREMVLAFNNMASSLQKSEYQRQEFVANVSHELKTPMTTIGGYIDGILDGTIPPERSRNYMQIVSDETKRLSRLVRSMLDISQLQTESGIPEEKKTRFDLEEVAGQMLITFEQKITAKGLEVEVDMPEHPVCTFANADYVSQVIYNLLDNAVKFCPTGGVLGLKMKEGGGKAYISIYNDGQTIPPEELPLVFDRFHKIDKSRSENRDGWGLGLYIVKTIVCAHGENISVTSRDGRTEFTFTMPLVI
ncbi:MAG: HAMP domain-containing histidine kinase [Oscillospiraceae bacterium]|nr:HAMP domain-containing histidine kinase [Oscillospiraceae bacterium]